MTMSSDPKPVASALPRYGPQTTEERTAWFIRFHGMVPGETPCPQCSRVVQLTDGGRCTCGRPFARKCDGITNVERQHTPCTSRVEARPYTYKTTSGDFRVDYEIVTVCEACKKKARRPEREEQWIQRFRVGGAQREDWARNDLIGYIRDYRMVEHREELDADLESWIRGEGAPCRFVFGSVGTGKTVGVYRATYEAFVVEQCVASFLPVEQDDLLVAYRARYGDVPGERREEAQRLIEGVESAELVVVDEMFSAIDYKNPYTATAAQDLGAAFRRRFDAKRRTLFTSNQDPRMGKAPDGVDWPLSESLWARAFDERMADRARAATKVIKVEGRSMRPTPVW